MPRSSRGGLEMRVGLVTWEGLPLLSPDDHQLVESLSRRGVHAGPLVWSDPTVAWAEYDLVVVRSTWDYHRRIAEFLAWLARVDRLTRVFNPARTIRWNSDKTYLRDLDRAGVPTVPTVWGSQVRSVAEALRARGWDRAVLKPSVSANAEGTSLASRETEASNEDAFLRLRGRGEVLIQPYMPGVDDPGEHSLVFLDGRYSHAAVRRPALSPGSVLQDGLPVHPTSAERETAEAAVSATPTPTLYARVDLVADRDGRPHVNELEAIEPALYLGSDPGSADRFASAILRRGR